MHTSFVVHVSKDLRTSYSDTVDTREDGILDVVEFEAC